MNMKILQTFAPESGLGCRDRRHLPVLLSTDSYYSMISDLSNRIRPAEKTYTL